MTRKEFFALLRRKVSALAATAVAALALSAVMYVVYLLLIAVLPDPIVTRWESFLSACFKDHDLIREWLGSMPWLFIGAQALQVVFAPIPGQAVALAGGYVFGFWRGWGMTTLGLTLGSVLAMGLARFFGERVVRRFVPDSVMKRFDALLTDGGYMTFFMIFLLPALPDDAVCFIAGLTRLRLLPLTLVCVLGRAPGMMVLSLVGAGLSEGLSTSTEVISAVLIALSIPLWLFWEIIEERVRAWVKSKY